MGLFKENIHLVVGPSPCHPVSGVHPDHSALVAASAPERPCRRKAPSDVPHGSSLDLNAWGHRGDWTHAPASAPPDSPPLPLRSPTNEERKGYLHPPFRFVSFASLSAFS